jgi:ABC-type phosphate/phosphonate transport system substrate-binding protein
MIASLGMYDLDETREATDALWRGIARALRAEGAAGVPDALDRARPLEDAWGDPSLLLAQICGFPLVHGFARSVRVVAAPCHAVSGCEEGQYRSVVVLREGAPLELRGVVAAVNDPASHSGHNALFALAGPVFSAVRVTGSHFASLAAVANGDADVAAIDCVTHALLARHRPRALEGTRVALATDLAPAPPYVTRASASDDDVARLRAALARAFADPSLADARDALLLTGVSPCDERPYAKILEVERSYATLIRRP